MDEQPRYLSKSIEDYVVLPYSKSVVMGGQHLRWHFLPDLLIQEAGLWTARKFAISFEAVGPDLSSTETGDLSWPKHSSVP
jgi:hypothetical protein